MTAPEPSPDTLRDTALWLVYALLTTARALGAEALASVLADTRDRLDALPDVDPPM